MLPLLHVAPGENLIFGSDGDDYPWSYPAGRHRPGVLRHCPSQPSLVAPSSSSWLISSLLGCRLSGVSVPNTFVSCLGCVCVVCRGGVVFVAVRSDVCGDDFFII